MSAMCLEKDFNRAINDLRSIGIDSSTIESMIKLRNSENIGEIIKDMQSEIQRNMAQKSEFDRTMAELKDYGVDESVLETFKKLQQSGEDVSEIMMGALREAMDNKSQLDRKQKADDEKSQLITRHLWDLMYDNIESMTISRTSIYLEAIIGQEKCKCLLDTGAQNNIITMDLVKKCGLESFVDKSNRGKVKGVGNNLTNIVGCIPYIDIIIDGMECPCYFQVLEQDDTGILLGLPFMMFYQVELDFKKRKLTIGGKQVNMIIAEPPAKHL